MANHRATFAKRQREGELKDRARAKQARRAAKKTETRTTKGPEIAWDEAVYPGSSDEETDKDTTPSEGDSAPVDWSSDTAGDSPPRGT